MVGEMGIKPGIEPHHLSALHRAPATPVEGRVNGSRYTARLAIPNYAKRIAAHYGVALDGIDIPFDFQHFGLVIDFDKPVELQLYDEDRVLDDGLRGLIERFGPIALRNAYLPERSRTEAQRNIFQNLSFHQDRGGTQEDCYSLFWRDPFDPVHWAARTSSTLFLANVVAYLQALREGHGKHEFKGLYKLFENEEVPALVGEVLFEQPWQAPEGTGEISVLDNRTVLHASYYARDIDKGYPIGVRYLF